jgi:formamidopyrimidine-DNA glycosylase
MPELPEVQTTAKILNKLAKGRTITAIWTDYDSPYYYNKINIKDPKYFRYFQKRVTGQKIIKVWRRAKNVLIELQNKQTILIHMKMTGQLLYGKYAQSVDKNCAGPAWRPTKEGPLKNPFSRFVHLVFSLDNNFHIAFSDMRKFGTIKLLENAGQIHEEFKKVGPEPLQKDFNFKKFSEKILLAKKAPVKTALMNPNIIAGIGNIYSDEILFASKVLPERKVDSLTKVEMKLIFNNLKKILLKGISLGGDSMSDYRNPYGEKGNFQLHHQVYGRKGEKCLRRKCLGLIKRKVINGRSAHYCSLCQK